MILSKNFVNRFIKKSKKSVVSASLLVISILLLGVCATSAQPVSNITPESGKEPRFIHGETIYADVDTTNNRLFVVLSDGLWQFDLDSNRWSFLSELNDLPDNFAEFEFAYNDTKDELNFWDRGVGRVFKVDPKTYQVTRIDKSHSHKNQFKHQPFVKEGNIYAFGGYGYWIWKNYMTYYDGELKEWSVQNIDPASDVPRARVPHTGVYSSSLDEFFIYGGSIPNQKLRADDQYTFHHDVNDIWRFSFADNRWEKITDIDQRYRFYDPASLLRIGRTNRISGSAYSNAHNVWYIPTVTDDASEDLVFLKLIHAASGQVGESILLPSIKSKPIVPTNFLFNARKGNLIIVGITKITDATEYPVEIIRVSEDSLLSEQQFAESTGSRYWVYILLLILVTLLVGAYYWKKRLYQKSATFKEELVLTKEGVERIAWLKSEEKQLLKHLFENQGYLESMKIDEAVWPDIDNYDYRRKLRNDTINSINKKFKAKIDDSDNLIARIKDPDDNRRYLYGLNEEFIQS